jgi:hypothetical protein
MARRNPGILTDPPFSLPVTMTCADTGLRVLGSINMTPTSAHLLSCPVRNQTIEL